MRSTFTIAGALATFAVALPAATYDPSPPLQNGPVPPLEDTYYLTSKVIKGPESLNNFFLAPFHTGAGTQTIVGTTDVNSAARFYIDGTSHTLAQLAPGQPDDEPKYRVALLNSVPYQSDAPVGYYYVALNFLGSQPTQGFGLVHDAGTPNFYAGYDASHPGFGSFALCQVNGTSPSAGAGPQKQLLWRNKDQTAGDFEKCADIGLKVQSP